MNADKTKYIALVTGAVGGLGTDICRRLADDGHIFHVVGDVAVDVCAFLDDDSLHPELLGFSFFLLFRCGILHDGLAVLRT